MAWNVIPATASGLMVVNVEVFSTWAPVLSTIEAVTLYVLP